MVTLIYVRKGLSKKLFLVAFLEVKSINSILLAFSYSLHVQSCVAFVMAKYWISMEKKPGHGRNIFLVRKLEQFEMFNERITQIWGEWKLLKHKVRFRLFLAIFGPKSHFYRFLDHSVYRNERMAQSHPLHLPSRNIIWLLLQKSTGKRLGAPFILEWRHSIDFPLLCAFCTSTHLTLLCFLRLLLWSHSCPLVPQERSKRSHWIEISS